MKRIFIAGVLGAIVYFMWGMSAWLVFHLHDSTVTGITSDEAITKVLQEQDLETGVYVAPWPEDEANPSPEFLSRSEAGPIYSIYYHKEGSPPMPPSTMIAGFIINFLNSSLAACLLSGAVTGCCRSYAQRVGFCTGLGIFVGLAGHAMYWNWMHFPLDYTIMFIVDVTIGWTLTGLVIAAIIKPQRADAWDQKEAAT